MARGTATGARIITWNTNDVESATMAGICSDDPAVLVQAQERPAETH